MNSPKLEKKTFFDTPEEIEKMRIAGRLAAEVLEMIEPHVVAGITTGEINRICHDYIVNEQGCIPAPLNYGNPPFPGSICTSINQVICHGIPSDKKALKKFNDPPKAIEMINEEVEEMLRKEEIRWKEQEAKKRAEEKSQESQKTLEQDQK